MVDFTEETSRKNIVIKKVEYTIAQPFAEGHVCTANEANALNQLLAENCRNNFTPKIEKAETAPTQEEFDAYVASYQFGVRSVATSDPVEKVMRTLVENELVKMLKAQGRTKSSISAEEFKNAVDAGVEKNREILYPRAKEIVLMQTAELAIAL